MDTIQMARELGKAIQADERYINLMKAQADNDADKDLQAMIEDFNAKRAEINVEAQKADKDDDKVATLNNELKDVYAKIFANPNMAAFTAARTDMQSMMDEVNAIISGSANGQDPDAIDPAACTGSCSSCAGCH